MRSQHWRDWSCTVAVTAETEADLSLAVGIVREVMGDVEAAVSRFRDDSDLARMNAAAGRFVPVGPVTLTLLELSLDVAALTGGCLTPTVGSALEALGYDADIEVVAARPATSSRASGPVAAAADAIRIDHDLRRVGVTRGTRLDLGALAKAYAVDEALRRVAARAEAGVLVSLGGDLAVHGGPDDGWEIAVAETAGGVGERVTIEAGALATSSTVGRRWAGGHHHIIDPRSGRSAAGPWRTATVWAPTAVAANTLSTWLLVDATAAARRLAADALPARLVSVDGVVERRQGWPAPEAVAS